MPPLCPADGAIDDCHKELARSDSKSNLASAVLNTIRSVKSFSNLLNNASSIDKQEFSAEERNLAKTVLKTIKSCKSFNDFLATENPQEISDEEREALEAILALASIKGADRVLTEVEQQNLASLCYLTRISLWSNHNTSLASAQMPQECDDDLDFFLNATSTASGGNNFDFSLESSFEPFYSSSFPSSSTSTSFPSSSNSSTASASSFRFNFKPKVQGSALSIPNGQIKRQRADNDGYGRFGGPAASRVSLDPFFVGSRVFVVSLGVEGVILCKKAGGWHDVQLQSGTISRYRPSDLRLISSHEPFGDHSLQHRTDHIKEHKPRSLDIEAMSNAFHNRPVNGASAARSQRQNQRPIKRPLDYGTGEGGGSDGAGGGGGGGGGLNMPTFTSADSLRCGMKLVVVRTGAVGTVVGEKFGGWRKLRFSDGSIGSYRPGDLAAYVPPPTDSSLSTSVSTAASSPITLNDTNSSNNSWVDPI